MFKRASISLLFTAVVVVLLLFAAAKAGAACDSNLPLGWCFESNGYKVEIVDLSGNPIPPNGTFPVIDGGNSVFTYSITATTPEKTISHVDILIPECTPTSLGRPTTSCSPNCICPLSSPNCTGGSDWFLSGVGDPSTGFGLGLTTSDTLKWYFSGTGGTVSLTLAGKVFASPNVMLVKVGSSASAFPYGQILAPSCGLIPAPSFPPQVPQATLKEEQIGDVKICTVSTDPSGCPTSVYSCDPPSTPTCGCTNPVYWEKKTLSDIGITPDTLMQVWTDPDPRCPATYIITKGSTCVKKCYPSGSCVVGPPGCT